MKTSLRVLLYLILGYLLLAIVSPLMHVLQVRLYAPDPALAIVVFAAAALDFLPGLLVAWLLGLLRDGFSPGSPIGLHMEIYVVVFLLCLLVTRKLDYRSPVLMTLLVGLCSLASTGLMLVFLAIFDQDFNDFSLVLRMAVPQAFISAPFGPIVAALLGLVDRNILGFGKDGVFK